jgi:hypothetical protein
MIPTQADDATLVFYVGNITAQWKRATADQEARGRNWYPTAHQLADMMSEGNVKAGAGVIAALSAQKNWLSNIKLAQAAFETEGDVRGHTRDACSKAERIMLGEDPLDVLPEGMKTWHFYRCILDPTDPDAVVVDRHAHDVAVGEIYGSQPRGLDAPRRYATLAHAYREAARQLGEIPSVVQAVTWVVQVERER